MNIRTYQEKDFDEVLELLNESKRFDYLTPALLHEKLEADPDWMPGATFITADDKKIVGFMQGVIRNVRGKIYGYIKLMAVDEKYRRQGIAKNMYYQLEQCFKSNNVDIVRIYDVPRNYFMPGIDPRYTPALCFASRMGFKRFGDTTNLLVELNQDWSTHKKEEKLKKQDIEVLRATEKDKDQLMAFLDEMDWELWKDEVNTAYKSEPIAIHIAKLEGKVKAFSAHNGNNVGTGWFGPMGTHSDLRGKGMGSVLLFRCLDDMKKWGLMHSVIPWVGPIEFYSHYANAEVDRIFWRYEKILKEGRK